jgi:hypothetical protein
LPDLDVGNQGNHGDNSAKHREVRNNRSHLIAPFDDFSTMFENSGVATNRLWALEKARHSRLAAGSSGRTNQSRNTNLPQRQKVVVDVHHNLANIRRN